MAEHEPCDVPAEELLARSPCKICGQPYAIGITINDLGDEDLYCDDCYVERFGKAPMPHGELH